MHDLNLTLFYKTSFQIRSIEPNGDVLWCLICEIKNWMSKKWESRGVDIPCDNATWSQFKSGSTIVSGDQESTVQFYSSIYWDCEALNYWACSITETVTIEDFAPRQWITEIGFSYKEPTYGTMSIVLSYGDRPGYLGECQEEPMPSVPKLINGLTKNKHLNCELSGMPLHLEAQMLHAGDFLTFWKLIADESRDTPIVYLSPMRYTNNGQSLVDPQEIARNLGPSAMVYYATDPAFNDEMRDLLPDEQYKCYNGFICVYASKPHIGNPNDSRRHRYFRPSVIEKMGSKKFIQILRRALAQDVCFYENMVRLDVVKSKIRRASIEKDFNGQIAVAENRAQNTEEESMKLLIELDEEVTTAHLENEQLQHKLNEVQSKVFSLEARAQAAESALSGTNSSSVVDEIDMQQYSPKALCELFATIYSNKIDFTDRAMKSLDECTTRPDILWNALYDLCTIAYPLHTKQGEIDIAKEFNSNSEFEYSRGAGMMTRKDTKLIENYRDTYRGRAINAETHIKKGNKESSNQFIRIYFGFDNESKKLVISSIGKHLDTHSTKFMK